MKRAIKNHSKDFAAILFLLILSVVVAGFILHQQRLRFPFIESTPFKMYAELSTGQAFTPGQGQSVRVSGVQIGEIGKVELHNGRAIVEMDIQDKYKNLIRRDATALARPRTGLQDMFLELNPGRGPVAKPGFTILVSNTLPEVNLDEIEAALDADTRAYLNLLINGAGPALRGKGGSELAEIMKRFLPTHRDLARLNQAVAQRGTNLRRLINSLQRLNTALAHNQTQIVQLVDSSATVFRAFASQDQNISRAIADLPATLRQTTVTLSKVQTFASLLGPTAVNLLPAARSLPAANRAITALAVPSTPIIRDQIRPFVIASRPLVRNLRPAARNLARATPDLASAFNVLNRFVNMLSYSPGQGPSADQHGYLWWLAWGDHEARTLFSVQDANGPFRPLFIQVGCSQLANSATGLSNPAFALITSAAGLNLNALKPLCTTLGLGSRDVSHARTARGAAGSGAGSTSSGAAGASPGSPAAGASSGTATAHGAAASGSSTATSTASSAASANPAISSLTTTSSALTSASPTGGGR